MSTRRIIKGFKLYETKYVESLNVHLIIIICPVMTQKREICAVYQKVNYSVVSEIRNVGTYAYIERQVISNQYSLSYKTFLVHFCNFREGVGDFFLLPSKNKCA